MRRFLLSCAGGMAAGASLISLAGGSLAAPAPAGTSAAAPSPAVIEFFEKKVRPVLIERCYGCHSARSASPMGGLRVDSRAALLKGGSRGPALVPGDPARSLLLQSLTHTGELKMPPTARLPAGEIEVLTEWIKTGAPFPAPGSGGRKPSSQQPPTTHWSFRPVRAPRLPKVKNAAWVRNPIDAFVLTRLEAKGLQPSPPADPRTLIRRAYFDLLGLPPSPEEVEAFVAECRTWERTYGRDHGPQTTDHRVGNPAAPVRRDAALNSAPAAMRNRWSVVGRLSSARNPSPDGRPIHPYEALVERLLNNPAYGERWGRYWLDVARYADTKGYVFFQDGKYPWAYTYRDYVVRAFNEDKPYDRFILEQLAADQLPLGADRSALAGMGFLTVGGRFMNNPHDILDDRIDAVSRGFLGLTVSCARCHDHKFDPVSAKDYYALYGVFAGSEEPLVPPTFQPAANAEEAAAFDKELQARYGKLMEFVRGKHTELVKSARTRVADYLMAAHAIRSQPRMDDFMLIADGTDLNPVMIVRWQAYLERMRKSGDPVFGVWSSLAELPEAEFAAKAPGVLARLDPSSANPLVLQAFKERPPKSMTEAAQRYAELLHGVDRDWQELVRRSSSSSPLGAMPHPGQEALRRVLYGPDAPPEVPLGHPSDLGLLPDRPSQAKLQELLKEVEKWMIEGKNAPPRAMVLADAAVPYEPRVFLRGNPNNPGEAVPRRFLAVLSNGKPQPFRSGSGRLELARAIADPRNPLTARVMVNRVWLGHFGQGLVRTPSDFGLRSDPPTHPELLDYLAGVFSGGIGSEWGSGGKGEREGETRGTNTGPHSPTLPLSHSAANHGAWSVKQLHRLIMLSSTYQQSSTPRSGPPSQLRTRATPHSQLRTPHSVDPENTLIWRMNRRRLDFEAMRDSVLVAADALDPTLGGPPVNILAGSLPGRRTLYGTVDRLALPGLLRTFDFPSPDATSPQRDSTTVPQQALFLMNNRFVQDAAKRMAARPEVTRMADWTGKVVALYRIAYSRSPRAEELRMARSFLGTAPGEAEWTRLAQALLMANEFVFID